MPNQIYINGEIGWDITAKSIIDQINNAEGDLEVLINSPGGYVFDGVEIYNALKAYNKGKVKTIITGIAASMASYIALAGDEVHAYDNATFMIHNVVVFAFGDYQELRKVADIAEGLTDLLANKYVEKTGASKEKIRNLMDAETWFFGEEIRDNGFVDEIIETDKDKNKDSAIALARDKFQSCLERIKSIENKEDINKLAAKLNFKSKKAEDKPPLPEPPKPVYIDEAKIRKYRNKLKLYRRGI